MKSFLVMGLFVISSSAFSAVFKSYDSKNSCDLYRVGSPIETEPREGEKVASKKSVKGFSFSDLEIDFKKREASVQIINIVALGLNTSLLDTKVIISANNPDFKSLINRVNRKFYLLETICISSANEIVYANELEK